MTTPVQRLQRLLSEGARFKVELPGQLSIDLTPDVIAALDGAGEAKACAHGGLITSPLRGQVTPQQPQSSKP